MSLVEQINDHIRRLISGRLENYKRHGRIILPKQVSFVREFKSDKGLYGFVLAVNGDEEFFDTLYRCDLDSLSQKITCRKAMADHAVKVACGDD